MNTKRQQKKLDLQIKLVRFIFIANRRVFEIAPCFILSIDWEQEWAQVGPIIAVVYEVHCSWKTSNLVVPSSCEGALKWVRGLDKGDD